MQTLSTLLPHWKQVTTPEGLFGNLGRNPKQTLKQTYRNYAHIVHPDHNQQAKRDAEVAFNLLQLWYGVAQNKIVSGTYGRQSLIEIETDAGRYIGYEPPIHGAIAELYSAESPHPALLKVARSARDNDLLEAESKALRRFGRMLQNDPLQAHFPTLLDSVTLRDAAGVQRRVNILRREANYVTLADVIEAFPDGVHSADMAWMLNRVLVALSKTHEAELVHGAMLPEHIFLRLSDHNGMLIDWCYSVEIGEPIKAVDPVRRVFYAPELLAKQPATPASDLYMAAKCMVKLLGGNPYTNQLPSSVPSSIRGVLNSCLIEAPHRRASNAWELFETFQTVLGKLYGPPMFRPIQLPNRS